ncbi:ras-related protein Rab-7L1-like, partial [Limulus polyphemus]|uniref:Ras-related protein Rab-7L1-like n=1 Tax=Limulus polyphemus TaxID=6850 RepID=A0ABM1C207_LIMPO
DFALKVIKYSDTETIKLQLWDIAGQERFTWMTRVYYKDAHGCVVMFDLTNRKTFDNALKWKKDVDAKCELADGCPLPCLLLANKCDLTDKQITHEELEALYQESGFLSWTEVSAKDGSMVDESMKYLVEKMQAESDLLGGHPTDSSRLTLGEESNVTRKCCG